MTKSALPLQHLAADALRARGAEPLRKSKMKNGVWAGAQRRPFASPETGQKGSRRRVSIAPPLDGTRDRLPPARGTLSLARGIEAQRAETLLRLGLREPGPAKQDAPPSLLGMTIACYIGISSLSSEPAREIAVSVTKVHKM